MKQDRFLTAILAGIGLLIILALASFFLRRNTLEYGSDDIPAGVIHNYLVAIQKGDYERAYGYLAEGTYKPSLEEFQQAFLTNQIAPQNVGVEIGEASIAGSMAYVSLSVSYGASSPFDGGWRNTETATLLDQNGQWKIESMPSPFWFYAWYQEPLQ